MKVLVCCKLVPEEQDVTVNADDTLNLSKAVPKISQFDLNAIQAAVDMKKDKEDISITALSIGGKYLENAKSRKDILSRGPDELTIVMDEKYTFLLPHQTAKIMAEAAKAVGFDLIICGDGSGDLYSQQTGTRAGGLLGIPAISGVSKIISVQDGKLQVERTLENEVEVLEISLPAIISVSSDINTVAVPGMKAILGAAKKPVNIISVEKEEDDLIAVTDMKAPKQKERKGIIVEGDAEDKVAEFISNLRKII